MTKDAPAVQLLQEYQEQKNGSGGDKETFVAHLVNETDQEPVDHTAFLTSAYVDGSLAQERSKHTAGEQRSCCDYADWVEPGFEQNLTQVDSPLDDGYAGEEVSGMREVFAGKKYKPVALKVRPVFEPLPEEFRIERNKWGPTSEPHAARPHPPEFVPIGQYTQERKEKVDKLHDDEFLTD
ncbi:hypothetical protein K438DRAFT_1615215 [Mycena galopus ATCC 62051]|nr:hypothetical protein K438DRAFT_1615215 [Mycena galopus ATCC 62051]